MALLGQSAFLKALGWALLNSIWQMAALWLVYLVLSASLRKQLTAHVKHSLSILLLGAGSLWFALTLVVKYFDYSLSPTIIAVEQEQNLTGMIGSSLQSLEAALPYFSSIYLVAIVFLFFRFIIQYRYTKHVSTNAIHKVQPQFRMYVQQIAGHMGIKKNIRVWLSDIVDTPMTIGFWKPVILMPIASVNGLSTQQVEAILLHELSHIKRNDYLVNLLVTTIDVILFFNPFSRLFIRTIKRERENSCDDLVLQFQYNAHAYASALLVIEQKRVMKVALGMAATGKNNRMLLDRVKRILNQPVTIKYNNRMVAHLFAGLLLALVAWSNPGNVIVKTIMSVKADVKSPLEYNQPVFVSNPIASVKEEKSSKKKSNLKLHTVDITVPAQEDETPELISQVAYNSIQYVPQVIQATAAEKLRDYSITEQLVVDKPAAVIALAPAATPFVPSTSFTYFMQDSTKPGLTVITPDERAATESLRKALRALEEINWEKLGKELKETGDKIDVVKLQEEVRKALKQVDWEKVNVETKLDMIQLEAKVRQDAYIRELTKMKESAQMQEHFQNLQKKVLDDQIKCQQDVLRKEQELKNYLKEKNKNQPVKPVVKQGKKVVYI